MAPNIPIVNPRVEGSDERSQEDFELEVPALVSSIAQPALMPELFASHQQQHFQNPDSPNLHILQHPTDTLQTNVKSQSARSTLRAHRPSGVTTPQEDVVPPGSVRGMEDVVRETNINNQNKDSRLPTTGNNGEVNQDSSAPSSPVPSAGGSITLPNTQDSPIVIRSPSDGLAPESLVQIPEDSSVAHPTAPGSNPSRRQPDKARRRNQPRTSTSPSTTTHRHDPGVLKLPGHEPEAPADLVLIHHDRAIDTRNQTGLNGIFVRDDSTSLTPEGATALILVGICIVFLVFICFIVFVQKIRRQRLERKVQQNGGDVVKPMTTYEATASGLPAHPLSLLPPALVQALTLAVQSNAKDDQPVPSFLTMEPPLSTNSQGRLWFSVFYDYLTSDLVLKVLHARYTRGRGWSSNPGEVWVEAVVLTPLNTVKANANTGTRRASSAPVFKQTFRFKVDDQEVTQYLLRLTLYDRQPDQPGEKASGSVIVPLSSLDLCSKETLARDLQ